MCTLPPCASCKSFIYRAESIGSFWSLSYAKQPCAFNFNWEVEVNYNLESLLPRNAGLEAVRNTTWIDLSCFDQYQVGLSRKWYIHAQGWLFSPERIVNKFSAFNSSIFSTATTILTGYDTSINHSIFIFYETYFFLDNGTKASVAVFSEITLPEPNSNKTFNQGPSWIEHAQLIGRGKKHLTGFSSAMKVRSDISAPLVDSTNRPQVNPKSSKRHDRNP